MAVKSKTKKTVIEPGFQINSNGSHQKTLQEIYGIYSFNDEKISQYLGKADYDKYVKAIKSGDKIDLKLADAIAAGMRAWALENGCTHYAHWFQPLTGTTAEKHDLFFDLNMKDGSIIEGFSGKELVQGEPDASSFPSGGIRATFEARGYTGWDPTSPAFIVEKEGGNTLCIPTIFVSYTGESLDKKGPLLRSDKVLSNAALGILKFFNSKATKVVSTLGAEQEYFLIDRDYYNQRPDLYLTRRTLFGANSSKNQQLEDQYFGRIPERIFRFMSEVEKEAYQVGIPLKTRHNEVAPSQYEFAPIFEAANIAVDHNQYLMDMMCRVAKRHGLACLFHEKPFAGINGSGKHNNWSMGTDTGENLLTPGDTPSENLQFLLFLVATLKAVHENAKILRAAIATSGNDHRLGANEAPPAIISAFLGEQLTKVLDDLEAGKTAPNTKREWMDFGIDQVPNLKKDTTDRNRTSPFAFTGNKFEFRAVGSSATNATGITILNTVVANSLIQLKQEIESAMKGKSFKDAAVEVLRKWTKESKAVRFEGNGYSEEWHKEAAKRGLPNLRTTPEALGAFEDHKTAKIFSNLGVLSEREFHAWYHVKLERYSKDLDIEAKVMKEMVDTQILPAAIEYQNELISNVSGLKELSIDAAAQTGLLKTVNGYVSELTKLSADLEKAREAAASNGDAKPQAFAYEALKSKFFDKIRENVDGLEGVVPDALWPLPKYREILFLSK